MSEQIQSAALPLTAKGWAAPRPGEPLAPFTFGRREPGPKDVVIDVLYCGVCHSDIHQVRDEWAEGTFPMVPGHEIVGRVSRVGSQVTRFKAGDMAGVGCMVNSCQTCPACKASEEQFCEVHCAFTYNSTDMDEVTPTYGGYSNLLVVDEHFALRIPANLDPASAAPLLCAGITTWSPLRRWKAGPGTQVAILGLGGLGHMAVQFARSLGAEVTVFSQSSRKEKDAVRLGAHHFVDTSVDGALAKHVKQFDMLLSTVSSAYGLENYLATLKRDSAMVVVGLPPTSEHPVLPLTTLVMNRIALAGSLIGGIAETQEMLDYCGEHSIVSEVEVIPIQQINAAYDRMAKGDVRYRFVIDVKTV